MVFIPHIHQDQSRVSKKDLLSKYLDLRLKVSDFVIESHSIPASLLTRNDTVLVSPGLVCGHPDIFIHASRQT